MWVGILIRFDTEEVEYTGSIARLLGNMLFVENARKHLNRGLAQPKTTRVKFILFH